ncbi:aconitase X swivel domain-containing protein [Hoeflea sp.]|uniref:aconitase X swivel domain-containing protein n=1 Tax=Hoeflea sp. TaxID=1940281 RepID=UPI003B026731
MAARTPVTITAHVLNPATAGGEILVLDEALSFWGGFDPVSGRILDRHHPQAGLSVTGKIVVMPSSRGSAGTPAGVAESIRIGTGPAAVILRHPDVNIAIGAMVAQELYGNGIPVLAVSDPQYGQLANGTRVAIDSDGSITIEP